MSLQARQEMLASIQTKYQSSDWKLKNQILDGFVAATGYDRKHAIKLLNDRIIKLSVNCNKKRRKTAY